jgi:signal peptidase I
MENNTERQPRTRTRVVPLPLVLAIVAGIVGIIAFIRIFVVQPVCILENSMSPTLLNGDRAVAVTNLVTRGKYRRGDVVRLKDPRGGDTDLIKRVIALPGDTFEAREGNIFVNGEQLDEPYAAEPIRLEVPPFTLAPDRAMVLGDNRNHSDDSSIWGPVPMSMIKGRAVWILWPPERVGRP